MLSNAGNPYHKMLVRILTNPNQICHNIQSRSVVPGFPLILLGTINTGVVVCPRWGFTDCTHQTNIIDKHSDH